MVWVLTRRRTNAGVCHKPRETTTTRPRFIRSIVPRRVGTSGNSSRDAHIESFAPSLLEDRVSTGAGIEKFGGNGFELTLAQSQPRSWVSCDPIAPAKIRSCLRGISHDGGHSPSTEDLSADSEECDTLRA